MHARSETLERDLDELKSELASHRLAEVLRDRADLRVFMEHHVVCVWDFMSLLKSLQRDLTCIDVPWVPPADPEASRFVNEIVLGEETDEFPGGGYASHFAWYLSAMAETGCDDSAMRRFLHGLQRGEPVSAALVRSGLPDAAADFVRHTLESLGEPLAVRVAVFFHGREDLIPDLLRPVAVRLHAEQSDAGLLLAYLDRHDEVDRDHHGPLCERLLVRQLERKPELRERALRTAASALRARRALWDAIADACVGATRRP